MKVGSSDDKRWVVRASHGFPTQPISPCTTLLWSSNPACTAEAAAGEEGEEGWAWQCCFNDWTPSAQRSFPA